MNELQRRHGLADDLAHGGEEVLLHLGSKPHVVGKLLQCVARIGDAAANLVALGSRGDDLGQLLLQRLEEAAVVEAARARINVLDVLLTEKRRQCLGAGIRPTFFVDGSRLGFINDFDLCTLIGNAADNAIEATSQLPLGEAREFSLSVTYRNDIAIIHCQNRFRGAIAGNGPLPRTTKGGDAADLV